MRSSVEDIIFADAECLDAYQVEQLVEMARRTFDETFRREFETAPFEAFLDVAYGPGGAMRRDLVDPSISWRIALDADRPVAYAKLRPLCAPASDPAPGAMELQQIYVDSQWQGSGVAQGLMDWAVATAKSKGAPDLYLTVFEFNARARKFYERNAFDDVGSCTFQIGNRIEDDRIWKRRL